MAKFNYKGYQYTPEQDDDDDVSKIQHIIWRCGRIKWFDTSHSPYKELTKKEFESFVDRDIVRRTTKAQLARTLIKDLARQLEENHDPRVEEACNFLEELVSEESKEA